MSRIEIPVWSEGQTKCLNQIVTQFITFSVTLDGSFVTFAGVKVRTKCF
jgi:hypothetical protein